VVEAMADVVENELKPWEPAAGRRTALGAGSILLGLGALALLLQGESILGGVAAGVIAGLLVVGGIVLARAQAEPEAGVAVALLSAVYAGVAGLLLAPGDLPAWGWPLHDDFFTDPLLFAGLGVLAVGLVAVVGLQEGRALVIPAIVVGAVVVGSSVLIQVFDLEPGPVFTVLMTLVVLAGSVFPWLALGVTGTKVDQLFTPADITADPEDIDPARVAADARVAHQILVAISATVGLLLVLVAPLAVSLGLSGTLLAVVSCLVVMLRTRQYRTSQEVLVGLGSGIAGLVAVAVSLLWMHPEWRPTVAVSLAATGAVLLAVTLVPGTPSLRRGRLGDVAETICLLAVLPLVVLATGIFEAVRG
jgi:hypothetical protein